MEKMNAKDFAMMITGREYRDELTTEDENIAKESNLIVIFGASDDLLEFRGSFGDEVGAYDGIDNVLFNKNSLLRKPDQEDLLEENFDEEDFEIQFAKYLEDKKSAKSVNAVWCPKDENDKIYTFWEIITKSEHEKFDIVEDGELYCKGIVIQM